VSESWKPTIEDITNGFASLADRVADSKAPVLERYVHRTLRDLMAHLEQRIPGLEEAPDAEAAKAMVTASHVALEQGREREGLSRALRALSFAPHEPNAYHLAASACFELGAVEISVRLLYHALWIHPGHKAARNDLNALLAFLSDPDGEERAA